MLTALVAVLYGPSLGFDFVFDDTTLILQNTRLRSPSGFWLPWTEDVWAFQDFNSSGNYFRPVLGTWLWLMWQLFGEQAVGWHLVTVLLHAGAAVLAFTLGRKLDMGTLGAFAGAALFAAHPLAIQTAAWAVCSAEIVVWWLLLGACLLWVRGGRWVLVSLGLILLAMLTVERAFALVGVLGLLAVLRPQQPDGFVFGFDLRQVARSAVLLCVPLACAIGLRSLAGVPLGGSGGRASQLESLWTAPILLTTYLQNALWPAELSLVYPVSIAAAPVFSSFVLPFLALTASLVLAWGRRRRLFLVGASAGLISLPLVAAFLPPGELVADRYTYGPLLFAGLFVGDLIEQISRSRGRGFAIASLGLLLLPLLALHPSNLWAWEDNLALYTRAHAVVPGHPKFTMNLSNELRRRGLGDPGCELARSAYQTGRSGEIPGDVVRAAYNFGNCLREAGDLEAATSLYLESAEESGGVFYNARHNLVVTLLELGRSKEAWDEAGLLIQEAPSWPEAWRLRAVTNVRMDRIEQAVNCYGKLLELAPGDADAQGKLELLRARLPP